MDKEFMGKLYAAGLKPAPKIHRVESDFHAAFMLSSLVTAFLLGVFALDEVQGEPFGNTALLFGSAVLTTTLYIVSLSFRFQSIFDNNKETVKVFEGVGEVLWWTWKTSSFWFTALSLISASTIYYKMWLYRPFLLATCLLIIFLAVTCLKSWILASRGGGMGITLDKDGNEI